MKGNRAQEKHVSTFLVLTLNKTEWLLNSHSTKNSLQNLKKSMPPALEKLAINNFRLFFCCFWETAVNSPIYSHQYAVEKREGRNPLWRPEQLRLEVKCSWIHRAMCAPQKQRRKKKRKRGAQKWSVFFGTFGALAGVLHRLSPWLWMEKTSLSDVALSSCDRQRGASARHGDILRRYTVSR